MGHSPHPQKILRLHSPPLMEQATLLSSKFHWEGNTNSSWDIIEKRTTFWERISFFSKSWYFMESWKVTEGIRTTIGWGPDPMFHWPSFQQTFLQCHRAGWFKANILMQGRLVKKNIQRTSSHSQMFSLVPGQEHQNGRKVTSGARKCKLRVRVLFLFLALTPGLYDFRLSLVLFGHQFPMP